MVNRHERAIAIIVASLLSPEATSWVGGRNRRALRRRMKHVSMRTGHEYNKHNNINTLSTTTVTGDANNIIGHKHAQSYQAGIINVTNGMAKYTHHC